MGILDSALPGIYVKIWKTIGIHQLIVGGAWQNIFQVMEG